MKVFSISDNVENSSLITPWSLIHLLFGLLLYLYLTYFFNTSTEKAFLILLIIHTIYEIKDLMYYFNIHEKDGYWANNSLINSIGDTVFAIIGFGIGMQIEEINLNLIVYLTLLYFTLILIVMNKKLG